MDFLGNSHYRRAVINPAHQKKKMGANEKDSWASTCEL